MNFVKEENIFTKSLNAGKLIFLTRLTQMSWYLGSEPKRGAPYNLNITFIIKNEDVRSKDQPLFGRVLSFPSRELFTKWIAALLVAEYGGNLGTATLLSLA